MKSIVTIFLFLIALTQEARTQTMCSNGGVIRPKVQSVPDSVAIDDTVMDCVYRCNPSSIANILIQQGITSILEMKFCQYYGDCQTFTQSGPNFESFSGGQYYINHTFHHSSQSNIFTLKCTFTALDNGSLTTRFESATRYLTRNLPVLLPQKTSATVDIGSNFSTEFTIFHNDQSALLEPGQFSFRKAIGYTYFQIQTNGDYVQINDEQRTVIITGTLVIESFTIEINSFTPSHVGNYFYDFPPLDLHGSLNVTSFSFCEMSYYNGLVWPGLSNGENWTQDCSNLGQLFSTQGQISLKCDLVQGFTIKSECYFIEDLPVIHLILIPNLNFTVHSLSDILSDISVITGVIIGEIYNNTVYYQFLQTEFTYVSVKLPENTAITEMVRRIETYFLQNERTYALLNVNAFVPSTTCYCDLRLNSVQENIYELCSHRSCNCTQNCTCLPGYTGSGKECGLDTDSDSYPDHFLNCISSPDTPFCILDNCPLASNTDQLDCDENGMGDACDGPICASQRDEHGIVWGCGVGNGVVKSQVCIGGVGVAYRECGSDGMWLATDISQCASVVYGSALQLCSGDPVITELVDIISNITNGNLGQVFPFGNTDIEAFSSLFACLASKMDFSENGTLVELFLNATEKVFLTFVNQTKFIEETIVNFRIFSKSINLAYNFTFVSEFFSIVYTKLLETKTMNEDFVFSYLDTQITFPADLLNEISSFQTCNSCNGISVSVIIYSSDIRLVINTNNSLMRENGLKLDYFQKPEILGDIVSVEFGNIGDQFLIHSFSLVLKTYLHSSAPFTITQLPSPLYCAKFYPPTSQWMNKFPYNSLESHTIECGRLESTGIYSQFGGYRIIEDSLHPLNMIGYIGSGISLVIFSSTILIYIFLFKLLLKIAHFINLIIAIIFTLYNLFFIFTLESVSNFEILCKISSIFMHFFITSSFFWLTAYTLVCYILISYPHYRFKKKSFLVIILTSTIFSLLLVFPLSGVFHQQYISNSTLSPDIFQERTPYCWINTQNIRENFFIWLVTAPLVVLYTLSIIILALALLKDAVSSFGLKSSKKLLRALSVFTILFGINWGLCLAYLSTNNSILAVIFAFSNASQAICFLYGVVLIPHQDLHQRIEYYTNPRFMRNIRWPEFRTKTRRVVTQAELEIRAREVPIITDDCALIASSEDSMSDRLAGSVDFSRLLNGHGDSVTENEIDIMDPTTFAPAISGGEEPQIIIRPRMKVLTEMISESESAQSEDSKEQAIAIYYPISISSQSGSAVNTEVLADQIDHSALEEKLLDAVVTAESEEMLDQSDIVVQPIQAKYAEILDVDSGNFQGSPPSKRVPKKPNKNVEYWEKKITDMNVKRDLDKHNKRQVGRLSIPTYAEGYFGEEQKLTRMMLPSGRMVTATPPPSETEENQTYSMPELIYLQSRSFTPGLFDAFENQSSFDLNDSQTNIKSETITFAPTPEMLGCSDTISAIEQELVADLDTLVTHVDTEAKMLLQ